ncbi:uncharacterized protein LOC124171207 [Ischnura elegans]|uniref:uncharacterized protein LOC124171207 n=1 Tax=Ischnura elegans TaxID=197161 RepID=UPI001ED8B85D|nr:uncharacterized protein LOC124171207 [Ischnura elegans]
MFREKTVAGHEAALGTTAMYRDKYLTIYVFARPVCILKIRDKDMRGDVVEYLDVLSDDELSEYELCQLPPEEDYRLTDEEDVNENDLGEIIPADTCGKISLTLPNRDDDGEKEKDSLPRRKGVKKKSSTLGKGNVWKKLNQFEKEIPSEPMRGPDNHLEELVALEPIELFFKHLPQQYFSHVANMSSLYAQQKGSSLDVTGISADGLEEWETIECDTPEIGRRKGPKNDSNAYIKEAVDRLVQPMDDSESFAMSLAAQMRLLPTLDRAMAMLDLQTVISGNTIRHAERRSSVDLPNLNADASLPSSNTLLPANQPPPPHAPPKPSPPATPSHSHSPTIAHERQTAKKEKAATKRSAPKERSKSAPPAKKAKKADKPKEKPAAAKPAAKAAKSPSKAKKAPTKPKAPKPKKTPTKPKPAAAKKAAAAPKKK